MNVMLILNVMHVIQILMLKNANVIAKLTKLDVLVLYLIIMKTPVNVIVMLKKSNFVKQTHQRLT